MVRLVINWFYVSACLVISSWGIHRWLHFVEIICLVIPAMIVGWGLINYLMRKSQRTMPSWLGITLILIATPIAVFLTDAAPRSARQYAIDQADHLITTLGVNVEESTQLIVTEDGMPDVGAPRYIETSYYLKEPVEIVDQKLYQKLVTEHNWGVLRDEPYSISYHCSKVKDTESVFSYHPSVSIYFNIADSPILATRLYYDSPFDCEVKE